jgi:hypothetical protein
MTLLCSLYSGQRIKTRKFCEHSPKMVGKYYASKNVSLKLYKNGKFQIKGKISKVRGSSHRGGYDSFKENGFWHCFTQNGETKVVLKYIHTRYNDSKLMDTLDYDSHNQIMTSKYDSLTHQPEANWTRKKPKALRKQFMR